MIYFNDFEKLSVVNVLDNISVDYKIINKIMENVWQAQCNGVSDTAAF